MTLFVFAAGCHAVVHCAAAAPLLLGARHLLHGMPVADVP